MMRRVIAALALAAALTGCETAGPAAGTPTGWVTATDPSNGRQFRCYWWQPTGSGGGTFWCYEPGQAPR